MESCVEDAARSQMAHIQILNSLNFDEARKLFEDNELEATIVEDFIKPNTHHSMMSLEYLGEYQPRATMSSYAGSLLEGGRYS